MVLSIRSTLLILLVSLQFFAPLLHAHADQQSSHFGLHIPGLEAYSVTGHRMAYQAPSCFSSTDGFIFAIADGIKESRAAISDNKSHDSFSLLTYIVLSILAVPSFFEDFPLTSLSHSRIRILSLSPRAPPSDHPV